MCASAVAEKGEMNAPLVVGVRVVRDHAGVLLLLLLVRLLSGDLLVLSRLGLRRDGSRRVGSRSGGVVGAGERGGVLEAATGSDLAVLVVEALRRTISDRARTECTQKAKENAPYCEEHPGRRRRRSRSGSTRTAQPVPPEGAS